MVFTFNLIATQHNTMSIIRIIYFSTVPNNTNTIKYKSGIAKDSKSESSIINTYRIMKLLSHLPNNSANITVVYDSTLGI